MKLGDKLTCGPSDDRRAARAAARFRKTAIFARVVSLGIRRAGTGRNPVPLGSIYSTRPRTPGRG